MVSLRPYQDEALAGLRRSLISGHRAPVLQLPTGGGKTHIACAVIGGALAKGNRVLFLAPRRELIHQAAARLAAHGIDDVGMIMSGEPRNIYARCQVASFDTLHVRAVRSDKMTLPPAEVVIVDEAHLSIARTRQEILQAYSDSVVIGLTATPARGDGRGLGEIYDDLVLSWPMKRLVEEGYLVPARYYAGSAPDLSRVKLRADGDYVTSDLAKAVNIPTLVGDVVENWLRLAGDKRTVVFAVNCAHSRNLCQQFQAHGVRAEHLDAHTPLDERAAILERIASGETQVLCNVFVATYGLDIPSLECAVLARPTRNIALYLQTCGRVLRTAPGKTEALILCHAGAVAQHGFLDDFVPWSLDPNSKVSERKDQLAKEKGEPKVINCAVCGHQFVGSRTCPACGNEMVPPGKPIPVHEADLEEVVREKKKANRQWTPQEKASFWAELRGYALEHGYKEGWANHKYKAKFGVFPNKVEWRPPLSPSLEVARWVKSQNIRWAKSRERAA